MEILEMIAEWRKGCSVSRKHPVDCPECTEALINAIEAREKERVFSGCVTTRFDLVVERLRNAVDPVPKDFRQRGLCDERIVKTNDIEAILKEFFRLDCSVRRLYAENIELHGKINAETKETHRVY